MLKVISVKSGGKNVGRLVTFKCVCGKTKTVAYSNFTKIKSCGCLKRELKDIAFCKTKKIDLVGQVFGGLTVVSRNHKTGKWVCKCECGATKETVGSEMKAGKVTSCGCHRVNKPRRFYNTLYCQYKSNAKKRKLEFNLDKEVFIKLVSSKCRYCDSEPFQHLTSVYNDIAYIGIDRVDNNKGYITGNVVPCCKHCNIAKRNLSEKDFFDWVNRVFKNFKLKIKKD